MGAHELVHAPPASVTKPGDVDKQTKPAHPKSAPATPIAQVVSSHLRSMAADVAAELASGEGHRAARLAVAASQLTHRLCGLASLLREDDVDWSRLRDELVTLNVAVRRIDERIRLRYSAVADELVRALAGVSRFVPEPLWRDVRAAPQAVATRPVSTREHLQRSAHLVRSARRQVQALVVERESGLTDAALQALRLQLDLARDAALRVRDKLSRRELRGDVEALSMAVDAIAEVLAMPPRRPWSRTFAALFDTENALRDAIGLPTRARPFSGHIDPVSALRTVTNATTDRAAASGTAAASTTPQMAINRIASNLAAVFDTQALAADAVLRDLGEPPPPPRSSGLEVLLELATNVLISAASGGTGALVGHAVKTGLERSVVTRALGSRAAYGRDHQVLMDAAHSTLKDGVLARSIAADAAKDGVKEMFKLAARRALTVGAPKDLNARVALNAFVELSKLKLLVAKTEVLDQLHLVTPYLAQAELADLDALRLDLAGRVGLEARFHYYARAMREWQNFKARAYSSNRGADAGGDNTVDESPQRGVVQVVAYASDNPKDKTVYLKTLRLEGGEPAALRHFRNNSTPLARAGLHQRIELIFVTHGGFTRVSFGVGPEKGLQLNTLSAADIRVLKLWGAGERLLQSTLLRAARGEYKHLPDALGVDTAKWFVDTLGEHRTGALQG